MQDESIVLSYLSLFALTSFFITLAVNNISKNSKDFLIDKNFTKPQAFHSVPVPRSGGIASAISLIIFFVTYFFFFEILFLDYIFVSLSLFFIGFLDDVKILTAPKMRLLLMIVALLFLINFFSIEIASIDVKFLNKLLENNIFSTLFVLLCFLFIVNGTNLIDGFNGLLAIQLLVINIALLIVNFHNNDFHFVIFIVAQSIILLCFLLFNFPKAKVFFGDGGAYLFGSLTALNIIKTNNSNPEVSSFFFCILLFYLFFEVFFSFFRKLYFKKSPLKPDSKHLHMLSYKVLRGILKLKDCNYLNSVIINVVYIFAISPALYLRNNVYFCKFWFFLLIILYILFYIRLYSSTKKQIDI